MKSLKTAPVMTLALLIIDVSVAQAFCGFFVAKADAQLYNQASQVVLVRDGNRTVLTMANDYKGELSEFALVVPVPTFITKKQIHVANQKLVDHLDSFTAPRLVEYFDEDPCRQMRVLRMSKRSKSARPRAGQAGSDAALGVTVEAKYTVGEYDILILSAKESGGLQTWLSRNGYKIPKGASRVLQSYIKQGMRFFVAKVNLEEQQKAGFKNLRPLQVAYEHDRFMLPIRLGMVNADGDQELLVYAITRKGRVQTTNYRTVKLPTGNEVPEFVKGEFADFYKAMFTRQVEKENKKAVFLEYAWNMGWCDPCAADPLSRDELRELGVFWDTGAGRGRGADAYVTRLHLRYDNEHFPDDLMFQTTGDKSNFQGRYVIRHPWKGEAKCDAARTYNERLPQRLDDRAKSLAQLTGWDINDIRKKIPGLRGGNTAPKPKGDKSWWESLWE